ncbi:hypothetical protein ACFOZ7_07175 [Natribaculum luteum]|uniref:Nucleotide exchange factor GrpE n=1 Tax=Natribaculum luteum TaxID=1586232 RepID=A0ABD5NYD2_9EURY|nr:hypothetical protein [Natribaculum luteum]
MAIGNDASVPVPTEEREETPETEQDTDRATEDGTGTVERRIEDLIDERVEAVETQIDDLERQLSELDDFTRISLSERRIQQNEENLAAFSDSLTDFAERTMAQTNHLEEQLEVQRMLIAALLEALDDQDVDVDLSAVQQYREERVVTDTGDEQLDEAIERSSP